MPTGIPPVDIAEGVLGAAESVVGLINAGKTKREAQRLSASQPQYKISPLAGRELSLTESDLGNGMSNAAQTAYNDLDNSQFSSSISSLLKGGGDVNSIGAIYGNGQEGRLKLAQMQDQLRLAHIDNYIKANNKFQQEDQTKWQVNEFAPWQNKVQANAAARQGAQGQIWNGLNSLGSAIGNAGQSMKEANQFSSPVIVNPNNPEYSSAGFATGVPNPPQQRTIDGTGTLTPMSFNF